MASKAPWWLAVSGSRSASGAVGAGRLARQLARGGGVGAFDASGQPLGDLLELPLVAVGVREERAAGVGAPLGIDARHPALAGLEVPDLADVDAAADQVVAGGHDVVDDQEQALVGLRHRRGALAELD